MQAFSSRYKGLIFVIAIASILWVFYTHFSKVLDYDQCELCDRHEYVKLFEYFESGESSQIKFPFYLRPITPFLAALLPSSDLWWSFYWVNLAFFLLSIAALYFLWKSFQLNWPSMALGFFWLMIHWTGVIRYNLMDYVTVDVPVYLVQALALLIFFKKKHKWFYLLTPLAILQKESFVPVIIMMILVTAYLSPREKWWREGKHLVLSLVLGLLIQKLWIWYFPEQFDQRSSVAALLYHARLVVLDPSRIIRWFSAVGTAFGLLPILPLLVVQKNIFADKNRLTLAMLSLMFFAFGLTAGEDMTRIIFLGFPFVMSLILLEMKKMNPKVAALAFLLSLPSLRLYPFHSDVNWAVDYAPIEYVMGWAMYYFAAIVIFIAYYLYQKRQKRL